MQNNTFEKKLNTMHEDIKKTLLPALRRKYKEKIAQRSKRVMACAQDTLRVCM